MQQRKGRVGRVSSGTYIRLFNSNKINNSFKKIETEFLLPYIISFMTYGMDYDDLLIKPKKERYDKTIKYYTDKGLDFKKNPGYINRTYNQYPCSLGEYMIIYLYGSTEEKRLLEKLDNADNNGVVELVKNYYSEFLIIAKKINLRLKIVSDNRNTTKAIIPNYFENIDSFYIEKLVKNERVYLFLKEGFAIARD